MITELERITLDELSRAAISVFDRVVQGKTAIVVENELGERVLLRPIAAAEFSTDSKTDDDYRAFLSAAGSWSDVDVDHLLAEIYARRLSATRPPVEL